ncbi:MAG: NADH-quinone oxidoreductase subunit J, partial [Isosphaeraceae bacterium]
GGSYLLLPHRHGATRSRTVHAAGAVLASLALLGFLTFLSPPSPFLAGLFFYLFSIGAIVGGLLTVTSRNPIYSALWFASVVLSTAGLFLLAGAQFLAAGTVIVYAGAIIVTFLFVIMLAQMEGKALYDRAARAPGSATFTCFLLFWCLLYILGPLHAQQDPAASEGNGRQHAEKSLVRGGNITEFYQLNEQHPDAATALAHAQRQTSAMRDAGGAEKPDVAGLGESLYSDHLVTVELAGTLLFVALIAAVAITGPKRPIRPGESAGAATLKT